MAATLTALAPGPSSATPLAPAATPPAPTETPVPATAEPTPASPACAAAYLDAGRLFCLDESGAPLQIAAAEGGEIAAVHVSPDGARVAFLVQQPNGLAHLRVVNADGGDERPLVGQAELPSDEPGWALSPFNPEWQTGTHTLFFESRWTILSGVVGPGEYLRADFWKVDADTGALSQVLPRDTGGSFDLSPDGRFIAVSRPTGLDLLNADGTNYRRDVIAFPFILTYSEYAFRPAVDWSPDSSSLNLGIPSEDPLAPEPSVALYRAGVDGIVQPLASLPGNFVFGVAFGPVFSPNGQFVAYARIDPAGGPMELHLVRSDGTGDEVVDRQPSFTGLGWAPDSNHFAYAAQPGGGGFLAPVEGPLQAFAAGEQVSRLAWVDGLTFYWHGTVGGQWGLWRQPIGGVPELQAEVGESVLFDIRP